ncbi:MULTISPECIES: glycosyltransferase [Brevundimonas]|uniref:glycosyltransferase n=1 Tax=Brevundimonas sp. ZS04 TaxID=1906854 RepID=UPI00096CA0D4|nr:MULTISPECIES: glycosyltransferase [Brevundimonas]
MRFVTDLQSCQSGSRLGGIGRYSLELSKAIVRLSPQHEHLILLNDRNPEAEAVIRREFRDLLAPTAFRICSIPEGSAYLTDEGRTTDVADQIRDRFIRELSPDILHVSSLIEGIGDDIATTISPDWPCLTAVTLYDLIPLRQADAYLRDPRARTHYLSKVDQLRHADVLLAISDYSAQEGLASLPGYDGLVADIRGGIDARFQPVPDARTKMWGSVTARGIRGRFLLYTASFDQRKNQKGLIEAFALMPAQVREGRQLVIVGNGWPSVYEELKAFGRSMGLSDNDVVFTGHVTDDELLALYNLCELFVFPTYWEGLGMPVLEAMACGAPVIGSNTTSVPEVLGWDEASFDPFDTKSISAKMEQALTDAGFMERLKLHARQHSAGFTWQDSAQRALTAIEEGLMLKAGASQWPSIPDLPVMAEDLASKAAVCLARNEIELGLVRPTAEDCRIAWLTSWGNRCGIASYSASLLEHLPQDIAIFAQTLSRPEDEIWRTDHHVVRVREQNKEASLAALLEEIEAYNPTDIVIQFNYSFFNFEELNRFADIQFRRGRRLYITLHSTNNPQDAFGHRLSDLKQTLTRCNRIFVHNDIDVERLTALGIVGNVLQVPLGVPAMPIEPTPRTDQTPTVAAYGFFLPHKGLQELVQAIAILRNEGEAVKLRLVNADYGDAEGVSSGLIAETRAMAKHLGVSDYVEFRTEFLENAESTKLLRAADLLVFPYQQTGESASAAVHMGLATGVPLAVTPLTIFDDVACAAFRMPGVSPNALAQGIKQALKDIAEDNAHAQSLRAAGAALRASQSYATVAAFMHQTIRKEAATEHWVRHFKAVPAALPHMIGVAKGDNLVSTGEGGILAYGPYMALSAGLHRLVVRGKAIANDTGDVGVIEIKGEFGARTIESFELRAADGVIVDAIFRAPGNLQDVEVLIVLNAGAKVTLESYEILARSN